MRYLFVPLLFICHVIFGQIIVAVPAEIKPFVQNGYDVLDFKTGDLNGDKKVDAILILKLKGEDTVVTEDYIEPKRPLLLLVRQANGRLKLERQNDQIVMCRECGGMYGDPYSELSIEENGFAISFYGGSAWRWTRGYSFIYNAAKKDWFIAVETESTYWNGDPNKTFNSVSIPADEFGEISFSKFKRYDVDDAKLSAWKVTSSKAYFYETASVKAKPLKSYLVKGDKTDTYRETANFILVEFENKKGKKTIGFILKKSLVRLKSL